MNEIKIKEKFIASGCLKGSFDEEVPVGKLMKKKSKTRIENWLFRIDLTCEEENGNFWILECKDKANPSALGQLLVYSEFVERKHKLGVVCREIDPLLRPIFAKYNVTIFKVN